MDLSRKLICVLASGLMSGMALAATMDCGSKIIDDGQREPVSRASVIERCGPATREEGGALVYEQDDAVYRLRFNADGELEAITEDTQQ